MDGEKKSGCAARRRRDPRRPDRAYDTVKVDPDDS